MKKGLEMRPLLKLILHGLASGRMRTTPEVLDALREWRQTRPNGETWTAARNEPAPAAGEACAGQNEVRAADRNNGSS